MAGSSLVLFFCYICAHLLLEIPDYAFYSFNLLYNYDEKLPTPMGLCALVSNLPYMGASCPEGKKLSELYAEYEPWNGVSSSTELRH